MFLLNKVISIDADSKIQISTYVWSASVKALDVVQSNLRIFKKTKMEWTTLFWIFGTNSRRKMSKSGASVCKSTFLEKLTLQLSHVKGFSFS